MVAQAFRIFDACGADIPDVGRSTAAGSCGCVAEGSKVVRCRYHR
jgi:hypothetical protein